MIRLSRAEWLSAQFAPATVRRRFHRGAGIACLTFSAVLALAFFHPGRWRVAGIGIRLDTIRNPLLELLASVSVFVATREGSLARGWAMFRRLALLWSGWDARTRLFTFAVAAQLCAGTVYVARSADERRALHRWMRTRSDSSFDDAARKDDRHMQYELCFEKCRRVLPPAARVLYHGPSEGQVLSYVIYPRPVFMLPQEQFEAWIANQTFGGSLPEDPLFPRGLPGPRGVVAREEFLREHRITHEVTFIAGQDAECRIEAVR